MSVVNAIPLIAAGDDGYSLTRSLRFRSSATAYLNRTFSTPTNALKFTWSGWVKRGTFGAQVLFGNGNVDTGTSFSGIYFDIADRLYLLDAGSFFVRQTNAVYRDPAAWYHIMFSVDKTTSVNANLYVNGVQVTSFLDSRGTLLTAGNFNSAVVTNIGKNAATSSYYFDGYMAEINFIDGQALTPSSFGEFSIYNQWLPKKYVGTYGTNGFYLPFTNNASAATLGNDFSGNSNTWTTNNISVTAGSTYDSMTDVPTLTSATAANFAVLNPLIYSPSAITFSNGNLVTTTTTAGGSSKSGATFGASAGKFYAEATITTYGGELALGVIINTSSNIYTTGVGYDSFDGSKYVNGTNSAYGATYGAGAVIGIALDLDGQTVTFYKNNTSQGTISLPVASSTWIFAHSNGTTVVNVITWNFGQQPFTYTPPTGYLALNTFNL